MHIRQFPKPDQQPKVLCFFPPPFLSLNIIYCWKNSIVISVYQLDDRALTEVMKKLFKNYKKWCKYLGRKSSLWSVKFSAHVSLQLFDFFPSSGEFLFYALDLLACALTSWLFPCAGCQLSNRKYSKGSCYTWVYIFLFGGKLQTWDLCLNACATYIIMYGFICVGHCFSVHSFILLAAYRSGLVFPMVWGIGVTLRGPFESLSSSYGRKGTLKLLVLLVWTSRFLEGNSGGQDFPFEWYLTTALFILIEIEEEEEIQVWYKMNQ